MQPDPSLSQELQTEAPIVESKKPARKFNFKTLFLVLLILVVAGLGYMDWKWHTQLTAAQNSLAALQEKHENLTSQKKQLADKLDVTNKEIADTKEEVENTQETLDTAKSDLSKSDEEIAKLREKMDKAGKYMEIMRGAFVDEDTFLETLLKILLVQDATLTDAFNRYLFSRSPVHLLGWIGYLLSTAADILK